MNFSKETLVGVLGAGAMGSGIAQIAATYGHSVVLFDIRDDALDKAKAGLHKILNRQVEKGRMDQETCDGILGRISFETHLEAMSSAGLIIEAVVENLDIKRKVFQDLEALVSEDCVLASNTSSLSIAAIGAACKNPGRVMGAHFFNPAPLMPLVEIIAGVASDMDVVQATRDLMDAWGKVTVMAKDTPGFIVNRVARPFYGEALRILDEGIADAATIDHAMKTLGGFRMGPFQLMDFIGHDVNFKVTETVFSEFYCDPRYKPSFTQKRLVEAGRLGRKTGRGFYDYGDGAEMPAPSEDPALLQLCFGRILAMLINEAADAVLWQIGSVKDIDLAMTKGVNYPKGLLAWADEIGLDKVLTRLDQLMDDYREDRYRASALLRRKVRAGETFTS